MDCREARISIHAAIDRELSTRLKEALDAHLSECGGCRAEAASARALVQKLKARCDIPRPSPEFRERLRAALDSEDRRANAWRLGLAAAAGLLLTTSLILALQHERVISPPAVIAATVRQFHSMRRGDAPDFVRSSDPSEVKSALRKQSASAVCPPVCPLGTLEGGCCCGEGEDALTCTLYDCGDEKIGLFLIDTGADAMPESNRCQFPDLDGYCFSIDGTNVIVCVGARKTHVWMSDLDRTSLALFVRRIDEVGSAPEGAARFGVEGMRCAMCAALLRDALLRLPGVIEVWVSLERREAAVLAEGRIENDLVDSTLGRLGFRRPRAR